MARKTRRKHDELEKFGIMEMSKQAFDAFVMPVFRLSRSGFLLKRDSWGHLAMDIVCLSLVLTVMGFLHFWMGIVVVISIPLMALFIGISRRIKTNENSKIKYDMEEIGRINYASEPIKETPKIIKQKVVKPIEVKVKSIPDFDENDTEKWYKFVQENPDMIRAQKQYK